MVYRSTRRPPVVAIRLFLSRLVVGLACCLLVVSPLFRVAASRWSNDEMEVDADIYCGGCDSHSTCVVRTNGTTGAILGGTGGGVCACDTGWTVFAALKVSDTRCSINIFTMFVLHAAWLLFALGTGAYSVYKLVQSVSVIRLTYAKKLTKSAEDRQNDNNHQMFGAAAATTAAAEPSKRGHQRNRSHSGIICPGELAALPPFARDPMPQQHGGSISVMGATSMRSRTRATYVKPSFVTNGVGALTGSTTRRATQGVSSQRSSLLPGEGAEGGVDFAAVLRAIKGDASPASPVKTMSISVESSPPSTTATLLGATSPGMSRRMQMVNRPGIDTRLSPRHSTGGPLMPQSLTPNTGLDSRHQTDGGGDTSARQRQSSNPNPHAALTARSVTIGDQEEEKQLTAEDFDEEEAMGGGGGIGGMASSSNPHPTLALHHSHHLLLQAHPTIVEEKYDSPSIRAQNATATTDLHPSALDDARPAGLTVASPTGGEDSRVILSPASGLASPSGNGGGPPTHGIPISPSRVGAAATVGGVRMTPTTDRVSTPNRSSPSKPHIPVLQFPPMSLPPPPATPPMIPAPSQADSMHELTRATAVHGKATGRDLADALEALQSPSESPMIQPHQVVPLGRLAAAEGATGAHLPSDETLPSSDSLVSPFSLPPRLVDDATQQRRLEDDLSGSIDFGTTMGSTTQVYVHRNAAHLDLSPRAAPVAGESEERREPVLVSSLSGSATESTHQPPSSTSRPNSSSGGGDSTTTTTTTALTTPTGMPVLRPSPGLPTFKPSSHTRGRSRDLVVPLAHGGGGGRVPIALPPHPQLSYAAPSNDPALSPAVSKSLPLMGPTAYLRTSDAFAVSITASPHAPSSSVLAMMAESFDESARGHTSALSPADAPLSRVTRLSGGGTRDSPAPSGRRSTDRRPSENAGGGGDGGGGGGAIDLVSEFPPTHSLGGTMTSGLHSGRSRRPSDFNGTFGRSNSSSSLGGMSDLSLVHSKRLTERPPHPILGSPIPLNVPDKPAFILGLSNQRVERKRASTNGGGGGGGLAMKPRASQGGGWHHPPPSSLQHERGGGTSVLSAEAPSTRASTMVFSPPLAPPLAHVRLWSAKFLFDCLKHISFQYSLGAVLICLAQLVHTVVQLISDSAAYDLSASSSAFAAPSSHIRRVGTDALATWTYTWTFTLFSWVSHLFFASHLKLAYSMVGLRGASSGAQGDIGLGAASGGGGGVNGGSANGHGGLAIVPGSRRGSRSQLPLSGGKSVVTGMALPTSGGGSRVSSGDQATAHGDAVMQTPRIQPTPFSTRNSHNLLCRCFSQEREAFAIKLYMLVECLILSAVQLVLGAAPQAASTESAQTIIRLSFVGATVLIMHFGAFSRVFTVSLKSLVAAGTQSLNLKQFSERKSVLYRLKVLIWTNRICGSVSFIVCVMLIVSDSFRQSTGAYLLPALAIQMDIIVVSRLWSINWRVKQPSPAAVGQSVGPLEGAALPKSIGALSLPPAGSVGVTAAGSAAFGRQAEIHGLASFRLRPARDQPILQAGTGSFRNGRARARQPSVSLSSQSSNGESHA